MNLNSKPLFYLIVVFGILNLADVITAMFILPGESNPIYLLTQSHFALWAVKILIFGIAVWVYYTNKYPSRLALYSFIYTLLVGAFVIGIGVYSNILGIINPTIIIASATLSQSSKLSYYGIFISILFVIPYIFSVGAFKLYEIIERKTKYDETKVGIHGKKIKQ